MIATAPNDDGDLAVTRDGPVATLWLNRPSKRNAVTYDMWNGMAEHCRQLANDNSVRVLVVRGTGEHFCAGADIAGLGDVDPADYQAANAAADHALSTFPRPTLAVITGACIGGGTEIAVACDLRLADTTARFGITPARLGIVYPAAATERLLRIISPSSAKHLLFSAEHINADRALRIGLIDELHEPDALPRRTEDFTELLANQRSLLTQMASKEIVDAALGRVDPEIPARWAAEMAASADPAEGVTAFLERRPPTFPWTGPTTGTSP